MKYDGNNVKYDGNNVEYDGNNVKYNFNIVKLLRKTTNNIKPNAQQFCVQYQRIYTKVILTEMFLFEIKTK